MTDTPAAPAARPGRPAAAQAAGEAIRQWADSPVTAKSAAARLALLLAAQEPGTRVASREKIAADLAIHPSTAQQARILLQGAGIIRKSGRHLYISPRPAPPPPETGHPEQQ